MMFQGDFDVSQTCDQNLRMLGSISVKCMNSEPLMQESYRTVMSRVSYIIEEEMLFVSYFFRFQGDGWDDKWVER